MGLPLGAIFLAVGVFVRKSDDSARCLGCGTKRKKEDLEWVDGFWACRGNADCAAECRGRSTDAVDLVETETPDFSGVSALPSAPNFVPVAACARLSLRVLTAFLPCEHACLNHRTNVAKSLISGESSPPEH